MLWAAGKVASSVEKWGSLLAGLLAALMELWMVETKVVHSVA